MTAKQFFRFLPGILSLALLATLLQVAIGAALPAVFGPSFALADTPACNLTPCVIKSNGGGSVKDFTDLALRLKRTKEKVVIDGPCYSACTILADQARPYVCVTPNAKLYIHAATVQQPADLNGMRLDVQYTKDISEWVKSKGGQPTVGFLLMDYRDQLLFFEPCKSADPPTV